MELSDARRADLNTQARLFRPVEYSEREVAEMALEADLNAARAAHGPEFALVQATFDIARDIHRELQRGFAPSRQVWLWRGARTPRARRVRAVASASAGGGGSSGRPRSTDNPAPLGAPFQLAGVTL